MPICRHAATTPAEKELTQAVRRVVDRYGSDLSVYFRRVEEIAKRNSQETGAQDATKGKRDDKSTT